MIDSTRKILRGFSLAGFNFTQFGKNLFDSMTKTWRTHITAGFVDESEKYEIRFAAG